MAYIVGITGRAGSGKDTLATILRQKLYGLGYSSSVFSFAAPIRCVARDVGLEPDVREKKEVETTLEFDDFEDHLIQVIDYELVGTYDNARAELFSFFVDDLEESGLLKSNGGVDTLTVSPRVFMQMLGTAGRKVNPYFWVNVVKEIIDLTDTDIAILSDVRFPEEAAITNKLVGRGGGVTVASHESESHIENLLVKCSTVVNYYKDVAGLESRAHSIAVHTGYHYDRSQLNPQQAYFDLLHRSKPLIKS